MISPYRGLIINVIIAAFVVMIGLGLQMFGMWEGEKFKPKLKEFADKYDDYCYSGEIVPQGYPACGILAKDVFALIEPVDKSQLFRGIGIGLTILGSIISVLNWYIIRKSFLKVPEHLKAKPIKEGEKNADAAGK